MKKELRSVIVRVTERERKRELERRGEHGRKRGGELEGKSVRGKK